MDSEIVYHHVLFHSWIRTDSPACKSVEIECWYSGLRISAFFLQFSVAWNCDKIMNNLVAENFKINTIIGAEIAQTK
jgi:hypothetical protein